MSIGNIIPYNRAAAVDYAHRWAYDRNPKYADFSEMGGDCSKEQSPINRIHEKAFWLAYEVAVDFGAELYRNEVIL